MGFSYFLFALDICYPATNLNVLIPIRSPIYYPMGNYLYFCIFNESRMANVNESEEYRQL